MGWQNYEWIGLVQVRKQCLAIVNKELKLLVLPNAGNFLTN